MLTVIWRWIPLKISKYENIFDKRFWGFCLIAACLFFGGTFLFSHYQDQEKAEEKLSATIEFIKDRQSSYTQYNDIAAARSLIRSSVSVRHLSTQSNFEDPAALQAYAEDLWVTGISVLDTAGHLLYEYTADDTGFAQIQQALDLDTELNVTAYPQKTFTKRIWLADHSFVDVAAHARSDAPGILLAYRHTPAAFAQKSVLSIQSLLDGYTIEDTGTLFITEGDHVIASNNAAWLDKDVSDNALVQSIRSFHHANQLTHTKIEDHLTTYYGMYSHGQDFYIYAYLPESAVFQTTTTNMAGALLLYILLISLFQMLRWRSSQKLIQQQNKLDEAYKSQLEEKNQELERAVRHEAAANRSKREFLFNMSHDIRTPMNAIVGFTSLAATHIDNQEQALDYLKKISVSSQHLLSLINDILDMSRIESGKVKIEKKAVHLPDLIHDIRAIIQPNVAAKRLSLFIDTMDVIHEDIVTDPLRLNQVLLNILSNAIKFTPAGGTISIRIFQKETLHKGCADYEFHIKDTGIGISKAFQAHIFEEFTRENTSTVSGIHGTGLGMSIAKNIVDLLGGTIAVESEPGQGSEFTVCLRFPLSDAKTEQKRIPQLEGLRALVADDDTNSCLNVSKMLRKIGMRPDWTISGKEAVIRARDALEQGDSFSVYIIDWLIPDMNGIEVVRQIRKMIGEQTPIIILTAYDWADVEEEARKAGVTAFCTKPLFLSELREILAKPFETPHALEAQNPVTFAGKKVLLVEDNSLNQEIALAILRERGLIVDTACDGSIAVQKVHDAQPGQYDLILMDIQMPIMDGYEATRRIRLMDDPEKANLPIIAITANAFEEDCQNALDAGMNGHIAKPLDIQKLEQVLTEFLGS